jgi:plastocyanin
MRSRAFTALAVAALVGLGLGACGDDDDDVASDTGSDDTTASEDDGGAADEPTVTIKDFAFDPDEITVAVGGTIHVSNDDTTRHTFTSDDAGFDTVLDAGASADVRVGASEPGTYEWMCTIHTNMTGTITVE